MPSCRVKLYNYRILNNSNFYPSSHREKNWLIRVGVKDKVMDMILLLSNLPQ